MQWLRWQEDKELDFGHNGPKGTFKLDVYGKGKYLFEIARFKLWRTYSVSTSVSLVVVALSASVSNIVTRSLIEMPSFKRFCKTFCISPTPRSLGTSSDTSVVLASCTLLIRFCTSCLVRRVSILFLTTSVRCVAIIDGGSTTV